MKPSLVLLRGIPGTGKSTLAQVLKHFYVGAVNFEADQFFIDKNGDYKFDIQKIGRAHSWCQELTKAALSDGKYVIVSNTFTTKKELKPYFDMIHAYGLQPAVYTAQTEFGNIHGVPDKTLDAMRTRFEYDISSLYDKE